MNAATLCLVDPSPAQIRLDEQRRQIHRFAGEKTFPLNSFGWQLRVHYNAKAEPVGMYALRGCMGVDHSVTITSAELIGPAIDEIKVPLAMIPRASRTEFEEIIAQELDDREFDDG